MPGGQKNKFDFIKSPYLQIVIGLLLSAGTLFLASRSLDLERVWEVLIRADGVLILLGFLSVLCTTYLKIIRWNKLINPKDISVRFIELSKSFLLGQLINALLPARLGDLSRAQVTGYKGPGQAYVLGTIVIEKFMDSILYVILFIITFISMPLPQWVNQQGYLCTAVTVCSLILFSLLILRGKMVLKNIKQLTKWLPEKLRCFVISHLENGLSSLTVLKNTQNNWHFVWLTMTIWGLSILTNYLVLTSLGISLPWFSSILVLVILQASFWLPAAPVKVGIFEYACVISLSILQVDKAEALGFGILLHVIVFVPIIILGLFSLWSYRKI